MGITPYGNNQLSSYNRASTVNSQHLRIMPDQDLTQLAFKFIRPAHEIQPGFCKLLQRLHDGSSWTVQLLVRATRCKASCPNEAVQRAVFAAHLLRCGDKQRSNAVTQRAAAGNQLAPRNEETTK